MFAYNPTMGEMRRANEREAEERMRERFASTIAICASIIAAVRLAREPNIGRSSPRVAAAIADSITVAKAIVRRIVDR